MAHLMANTNAEIQEENHAFIIMISRRHLLHCIITVVIDWFMLDNVAAKLASCKCSTSIYSVML